MPASVAADRISRPKSPDSCDCMHCGHRFDSWQNYGSNENRRLSSTSAEPMPTLPLKWLHWVRWLSEQPGAKPFSLIVCCSRVPLSRRFASALVMPQPLNATLEIITERYEHPELGYAAMANFGFKEAREIGAERIMATGPMLWVESDAIPTRSTWMEEIETEYEMAGKEFMGDFHGSWCYSALNWECRLWAKLAKVRPNLGPNSPMLPKAGILKRRIRSYHTRITATEYNKSGLCRRVKFTEKEASAYCIPRPPYSHPRQNRHP